jgi:serine/threonine-protein kinase
MKLFSRDRLFCPDDRVGEYTVEKLVGEGRYGICYLACREGGRFIVKQLKKGMTGKTRNTLAYEAEILMSLEHESIPRFIERICTSKFNGYVLEYKEGKTFEELIYSDRRIFPREEIISIGYQLLQIVKCLHSRGVVHRDIRVPNTIYRDGRVYLVDFGLSRWMHGDTYPADVDFSFLGDLLLHLYYTSYEHTGAGPGPWYEELTLTEGETYLLKRLLGMKDRYRTVHEVESDYHLLFDVTGDGMTVYSQSDKGMQRSEGWKEA